MTIQSVSIAILWVSLAFAALCLSTGLFVLLLRFIAATWYEHRQDDEVKPDVN